MAIVNQFDKRSGITYVYESVSYWDKEKQQPRSKRSLIGKRDPATGEIIPTDGRGRKRRDPKAGTTEVKPGPVPFTVADRKFYGATYLLDEIGDSLGLTEDLKTCFPSLYKQIQSIAYYLILESDSPLFRFEKWSALHRHPYDEIFVVQEGRARFFVGDKVIDAEAGETVLGPAGLPHRFVNLGPGRLQTIDIHQSPRWIQTDLE